MKHSLSLLLILSLLCALLAGCAGKAACPPASDGGNQEPSPKPEGAVARCRVVAVSEGNTLLLADVDSERGDIYTLDAGELSLEHDQAELGELLDDGQLAVGALVEVAFGGDILESYPALFGGVERITVLPDEFDDRGARYLRVLNDLWGKDEGRNSSGVEYISVDLAATSLPPAERSAVAWPFAQAHDAMPLALNYEQLCEEGYISGLEGEDIFPAWENGVLFTITETAETDTFTATATRFDIPDNTAAPKGLLATFYLLPYGTESVFNLTYTYQAYNSDNTDITQTIVLSNQTLPSTEMWTEGASISYTLGISRKKVTVTAGSLPTWNTGSTETVSETVVIN